MTYAKPSEATIVYPIQDGSSWQGIPTILFFIANMEGNRIASRPHESMLCIDFMIKKSGVFY
jgi:hypothetical protein